MQMRIVADSPPSRFADGPWILHGAFKVRLLLVNERLPYASTTFYTLDLALDVQKLGDDVRLCSKGGDLREVFRQRGVMDYGVKLNFFSFYKLLGFLREFNPELIHIQNARSVTLGQRLSSRLGVPHVLTVHRVPGEINFKLRHPRLAGVIAANEMIRASLVNEQGISKSLIRVIKHGVNVEAFKPQPLPASQQQNDDHIMPVVGSVGRLTPVKGQDVFLRAARRVLDQGVEAMFMIVGEGEEERALRRIVSELKLEQFVTFLPHMPSRRELYRIFDIIVVPTLRGGLGATALEAMAMGKPVVASAVGELLHLIQHERTGLLVEEKNDRALCEGIVKLIQEPDFARDLGRQAREFVCENLALADMVKATRDFYEEVQAQLLERTLESPP